MQTTILLLAELGVLVVTETATLPMEEISTLATSVETAALHLVTMAVVAPEGMQLVLSSVTVCRISLYYILYLGTKYCDMVSLLLLLLQLCFVAALLCCRSALPLLCFAASLLCCHALALGTVHCCTRTSICHVMLLNQVWYASLI